MQLGIYPVQRGLLGLQKVRRWHVLVQQFLLERRVQGWQLLWLKGEKHWVH
jgi:hypothetical protein